MLVGLGWVLTWLQDRDAQAVVLPLTPFEPALDMWSVLQPAMRLVLAAVLVLVLVFWARRRVGIRRVARALGAVWVALCLVGAAGMVWRDLNVRGAQPLPPVPAQVIGSRAKAPSMRGPGGTLLVLRVHSLAQPRQVLVDDPQAAHWKHGQRLLLTWSRGRYQGLFVSGWRAVSAPAQAPAQVQAHAAGAATGMPQPVVALASAVVVPVSAVSTATAMTTAISNPVGHQSGLLR